MHPIDSPGATPDNEFTDGNPATGEAPTQVWAKWMNTVQRELLAVLSGAGIPPNESDDAQLLASIQTLRPGLALRNVLVNGDFRFWQPTGWGAGSDLPDDLGASYTLFHSDFWWFKAGTGGAGTVDRISFAPGQTDVPGNPECHLRWIQTTAASDSPTMLQQVEGVSTLAGEQVTFSAWLRVASGTLAATPALRQDFGSGGSADVELSGSVWNITTTWQKFTYTTTLGSISGKTIGNYNYLGLELQLPASATFTLDVSDIQLERGPTSTAFERLPFDFELARVQRRWEKSVAPQVNVTANGEDGYSICSADKDWHAGEELVDLQQRLSVPKYANPDGSSGIVTIWRDPDNAGSGGKVRIGATSQNVQSVQNGTTTTGWPDIFGGTPPTGVQTVTGHWEVRSTIPV